MNGSRPRSEKIKVKSENDLENLSRSLCVEFGPREHKKINWKFYFSILAIGREKFCFLLRVFFFGLRVSRWKGAMRIYEILCLLIFDGYNLCCHIAGTLLHTGNRWEIFLHRTSSLSFIDWICQRDPSIGEMNFKQEKNIANIFDTLHFFYGAIVCRCSQCLLGVKQWK